MDNKEKMENSITEEMDNTVVEEAGTEEFTKEVKEDGKVMMFIKNILSGVADQIVAIIAALVLYLVVSFVLKIAGYKIVMREEMFLIVFIISNVLYYPLVQEFLGGKTLGKKLVLR